MRDWLRQVAFAVGGELRARLLRQWGILICGDTVLALMRSYPIAAVPVARILSVDDFAFRRGRTYGSMRVDLERHHVVDLLPDWSGTLVAAWFVAHPEVQILSILSRDRTSEYVRAARHVAPEVTQVADRFHLIHNLREVLFRVFRRHSRLLRQVSSPQRREGYLESVTHWRLDRQASRERDRAPMKERL